MRNDGEAASWFSDARECAPGPQGRRNRPPSTYSRVDEPRRQAWQPVDQDGLAGCRLYRYERGLAGQPAEAWVRDALLAAGRADATPEPEQRSTTD
jgi:hypothetical protein